MYSHHLNSFINELEETLCILVITHLVVTEKRMGFDKYMDKIEKGYYVTAILTVHLLKNT
jgi:hypothetical protein